MRYLLDTCAAVWFFEGNSRIAASLRDVLVDPRQDVYVSAVSLLEIVVKHQLGKFPLPEPPSRLLPPLIERHGLTLLDLRAGAIFELERLPSMHRDPFDRLLVAQARVHRMTLVTPDPMIARYDVPVRWD